MRLEPGDVVTADFPGVTGIKRRPCVVISSETYHQTRPDVILGLLTSQLSGAVDPSDHVLQDWTAAGLRKPSVFRTFLFTLPARSILRIGHLTDGDWKGVQAAVGHALATA